MLQVFDSCQIEEVLSQQQGRQLLPTTRRVLVVLGSLALKLFQLVMRTW